MIYWRRLNVKKPDMCEHRRGRYDVIVSILETSKNGGATKTQIISKGNLSTAQADKYLDELEAHKFIKKSQMPLKKSVAWKTTDAGLLVIEACKICHSLADKFT
jgi:predicted transcriptional regulator